MHNFPFGYSEPAVVFLRLEPLREQRKAPAQERTEVRNCAGNAANSRSGLITRDWADFVRSGVGSGGTGPRPASVATAWL